MSYKPIDSKRDDFRKYLERTGVFEMFSKVLTKLLNEHENDKPENAIEYIRQNIGDCLNDKDTIKSLRDELEESKREIAELKMEIYDLKCGRTVGRVGGNGDSGGNISPSVAMETNDQISTAPVSSIKDKTTAVTDVELLITDDSKQTDEKQAVEEEAQDVTKSNDTSNKESNSDDKDTTNDIVSPTAANN